MNARNTSSTYHLGVGGQNLWGRKPGDRGFMTWNRPQQNAKTDSVMSRMAAAKERNGINF